MVRPERLAAPARLAVLVPAVLPESRARPVLPGYQVVAEVLGLLGTLARLVLPATLGHRDLRVPLARMGLQGPQDRKGPRERPEVRESAARLDYPDRLDCRARPGHLVPLERWERRASRGLQAGWARPEVPGRRECPGFPALGVLPELQVLVDLLASPGQPVCLGRPGYLALRAPLDYRAQQGRWDPPEWLGTLEVKVLLGPRVCVARLVLRAK